MWALLIIAAMIYALVFGIWKHVRRVRSRVEAGEWKRRAEVKNVLPWEQSEVGAREIERDYATFELDEMAWVERRLPFLGVLIAAAPLLGLLGTVAGMLATFGGMAADTGIEPVDVISGGISKALVTTQAGLVIAVPAAILYELLKGKARSTYLELHRQLHEELREVVS